MLTRTLTSIQLSSRYAELRMPAVIMAGEGDVIAFPDKHSRRLMGDLSGAELRIVPNQGHLFHYAVPEHVVKAINDVVTEAARGSDKA